MTYQAFGYDHQTFKSTSLCDVTYKPKMAESVTEAPIINTTLNETADNATAKIPSTPEGMAVAYSSLVIMALIPIFVGSFRSVRYHKEQKVCVLKLVGGVIL